MTDRRSGAGRGKENSRRKTRRENRSRSRQDGQKRTVGRGRTAKREGEPGPTGIPVGRRRNRAGKKGAPGENRTGVRAPGCCGGEAGRVGGDGPGSGVFRGKSCGACRDSAAVRPASGILYRARGEAACECTGGQPGQEERRLKQAGRTGVEEEERGSISGAGAYRHPAADGKESMRLRGQPGRQSGRANGETGQTGQPGQPGQPGRNRADRVTGRKENRERTENGGEHGVQNDGDAAAGALSGGRGF